MHRNFLQSALCLASICCLLASGGPAIGAEPTKLLAKSDAARWNLKGDDPTKSRWVRGSASVDDKKPNEIQVDKDGTDLINSLAAGAHGVDTFTEKKFGDCTIEVEVMVPKNSNSGIYVMGEYEIQVLDSYGKKELGMGDMGAIYSASVPKLNACKKPGEWQHFVIDFKAPRFDAAGKKTDNARVLKVTLNDQVIHENVEVKGPTPGGLTGKEMAEGPIMFQGDHGSVAYRNLEVTPGN